MRRRRARQPKDGKDEDEFHGDQGQPRLQHQAEENQPRTERVSDAGAVEAAEEVREAVKADAADHTEDCAQHQDHPTGDIESLHARYHSPSPALRARSPCSMNFNTARVPMKLRKT